MKHRNSTLTLAVLACTALLSCEQPTQPQVVVSSAPVEEPAPPQEPAPKWSPEIGGLYVFDVRNTITVEDHYTDAETYNARLSALSTGVRIWNRREYDGYPFRVVAGGEP